MTALLVKAAFIVITSFVVSGTIFNNPNADREADNQFWYDNDMAEIKEILRSQVKNYAAKNIILFMGDGMGVTVTTAGRIYKGQLNGFSGEEGYLSWEKFPSHSLVKTYCANSQVADSACSATAYLGGMKSNYKTFGVNKDVELDDCQASLNEETHVKSILAWAQEAGKETGFVTTAPVTDASIGALYAHTAHRDWRSDTVMNESKKNTTGCKDIARQLVEDLPGRDINVIMGATSGELGVSFPRDPGTAELYRTDGRNLINEWLDEKTTRGASSKFVSTRTELNNLDVAGTDYIFGVYGSDSNFFKYQREGKNLDIPSLEEMAVAAVKRLSRSEQGFFLMVEGGSIDGSLHTTQSQHVVEEVIGFDQAISAVLGMVDLSETLVIVTADHSHTMTINGYPVRGNDILGKSTNVKTIDGKPHTTLMYTNGPLSNVTDFYFDKEKGEIVRPDLTNVDTTAPDFRSPSYLKVKSETHGGEDVAVYATGPMSHLFQTLHEQTYVAHVMGYAACIGPFKNDCAPKANGRSSKFAKNLH